MLREPSSVRVQMSVHWLSYWNRIENETKKEVAVCIVGLIASLFWINTCSVHVLHFLFEWGDNHSLSAIIRTYCRGRRKREFTAARVTQSCTCCKRWDVWKSLHWSAERPHPPSIFSTMSLLLSFVRMEIKGRSGKPPLPLSRSRCVCNLRTGLQSATEPLFIRLILKSTFCRPRKRLAKL